MYNQNLKRSLGSFRALGSANDFVAIFPYFNFELRCFLRYDDTLVIPIIENTLFECELTDRMKIAMENYPDSNAVLVRRHGVYIWGNTWQRAKSQ